MKRKLRIFYLLICTLFITSQVHSQNNYVEGANEFKFGGLGYFTFGYSFNLGNDLKHNLERTGILNSTLPGFGYNIGGGGYFLFAKKFVVGGYGFGLNFRNVINKSNEMKFSGGGGAFTIGYVVYDRFDWMIYPSIGIGGMGLKMNIRNTADSLIYYGDYEIPLRSNVTFETSETYLDIGVSAHRIIQLNKGRDHVAGISLGMSVGYLAGFGENSWRQPDGNNVGDLNPGKYNSFYVKLIIGGGGFFIRKSSSR